MRYLTLIAMLTIPSQAVVGCATHSDKVAAANVDDGIYRGKPCPELHRIREANRQAVQQLSAAQNETANEDTFWVAFSAITILGLVWIEGDGSETVDLSLAKGHLQVAEREIARQGC